MQTLIFGKQNQLQFSTSKHLGDVLSMDLFWQPSFSMFCFYYQCHHKLTVTAVKLTRQTVAGSSSGSKSKCVSNIVLFACVCPVQWECQVLSRGGLQIHDQVSNWPGKGKVFCSWFYSLGQTNWKVQTFKYFFPNLFLYLVTL